MNPDPLPSYALCSRRTLFLISLNTVICYTSGHNFLSVVTATRHAFWQASAFIEQHHISILTTPSQGTVRRFFWCILPSKYAPGAPQASRGGGRGQHQPKPGFGHAMPALGALAPKAKQPRIELPPRPERSRKSAQIPRRALAWLRAPRLYPQSRVSALWL